MPRQRNYNNYIKSTDDTFLKRLFWILCITTVLFAFGYMVFVYQAVSTSFKIQQELRSIDVITTSYQKIEEAYVSQLEELRASGENSFGLLPSRYKIFVDRHVEVVRLNP